MKIAVASDHAGFILKEHLKKVLKNLSHEVMDYGTDSTESVDYPDYAAKAAQALSRGDCERVVLVCGSGIGMSIAANRFSRVRAALCRSVEDAELSRRHNDSNALAVGGSGPKLCQMSLHIRCAEVRPVDESTAVDEALGSGFRERRMPLRVPLRQQCRLEIVQMIGERFRGCRTA